MSDLWIEWRVWRQFATLAEELHFGRAAQRLHMTQPPLTQAIAGLERTLGVRLFDRTKRSVRLTATGQALLPAVLDVLARAQALPARARAAADGEEGRLRLAFVSTVGFDLLPGWVRRFRDRFGAVQLDLVEATGDVQLGLLERGEVDAGFILHSPGFVPPGLMRYSVAREPLVVAVPESHGLASQARLSLGDVLTQPLVVFPRRIVPSLYDAIFGLYHAAGHSPVVAQEAIQMQTIINLVAAGLGLAWVPASVQAFQRPGVVYRELAPGDGFAVPLCETSLIWQGAAVPVILQRFIEVIGPAAD
jgi:DNA-binding transcriptional LysR family regulator